MASFRIMGLAAPTYTPLIPNMTSDTQPSGTCSASGISSGYNAYKAFDGNLTTDMGTTNHGWLSGGESNQYVQYKFATAAVASRVLLRWCTNNVSSVKLQGSNNGSSWTDLTDTITLSPYGQAFTVEKVVDMSNTTSYLYYRLSVLSGSIYYGYGLKMQLYKKG